MSKSHEQIEMDAWNAIRDWPKDHLRLIVLDRVLNNVDYALRNRKNQTEVSVTIASDFAERLYREYLAKANDAYRHAALTIRVAGGRVQLNRNTLTIANMHIVRVKAKIELAGIDLKKVQQKWREVKAQMKAQGIQRPPKDYEEITF
jgi:hypothetical protein